MSAAPPVRDPSVGASGLDDAIEAVERNGTHANGGPTWHADRPMVGRDEELASIDQVLDTAEEPRCAAIVGEPGIGKTALLRAAASRGQLRGFPVLEGRATEFERGIPFGLAVDALDEELGRLDRSRLDSLGESGVAELASVFPSVGRRHRPTVRGGTHARFRWHHAVRIGLEAVAEERPLIVCLDDVHWADDTSIELLAHLLNRPPLGVALLVAFQPAVAPSALHQAVSSAARAGTTVVIEPRPLNEEQARALVGGEVDPDQVSALNGEAGGNPFYLTELARAMGRPRPQGPDGGFDDEEVPSSVAAQIDTEVARAGDESRRLLTAAAVANEPFALELAIQIAGLDERQALDALDELLALELVRPSGRPRQFAFRHPIVRRAVYASAGPGSRLACHARAARVLEGAGAPLLERAHHVERSASPGDDSAAALLASAAHTVGARAPATAARWLARALEVLPHDADSARRLGLLLPLAASLSSVGDDRGSRQRLEEALSVLDADEVALRAVIACGIARLDHAAGGHGDTRPLQDALDAEGPTLSAESVSLMVELAIDHCFGGNPDEMAGFAIGARERARELGDPLLLGTASALLAHAKSRLGATEEARDHAEEAARLLDHLPDADLATRPEAMTVLAAAELGLDRVSESARRAERAISLCGAKRQSSWRVLATCILSHARLAQGRLEEAESAARWVIAASELAGPPRMWALSLRSCICALRGDLRGAVSSGEEAVGLAERMPRTLDGWLAHFSLALAEIEICEPALARERILDGLGGPDLTLADPNSLAAVYGALCRAELARGELDAAIEWVARADDAAAEVELQSGTAAARAARAEVLLARGDPTQASELAFAAAVGFAGSGQAIDAARALIIAGSALGAAGDRATGIERLLEVHARLNAWGASRLRDQAARELRRLGRRMPRRGTPPPSSNGDRANSLSAREREVVAGVVRGMRNREIAAELLLSPKTIERHLSRIFAKVGVSSRAELASAVERNRLDYSEAT